MTGTFHANRTCPLTSVVPLIVRKFEPQVALIVTVALPTGARFCATNVSTFTVCPPIARSGTVRATLKTPVGGGTVTKPAGWIFTRDQMLYSCGGVLTQPCQASFRNALRFFR